MADDSSKPSPKAIAQSVIESMNMTNSVMKSIQTNMEAALSSAGPMMSDLIKNSTDINQAATDKIIETIKSSGQSDQESDQESDKDSKDTKTDKG
ncbi:hypothetical protein V5T82_17625 [Magnetovibrio sp. PR-2]|uniref:hypothetical protein n=1 Tax=Magnetovibrio sp. PR-2 TaxID=3120356 RepID=UPI002FCE4682